MMRQGIVVLVVGLYSLVVLAQDHFEPHTQNQFCEKARHKDFFKQRLESEDSRLAFQNQGGLINGGVCWWHSRFQRNAVYLTILKPELSKPTDRDAKKLISLIRKGNQIVIIPGYATIQEFSHAYSHEIIKELEAWQRLEGFVEFAWISGLQGQAKPGAKVMEKNLEEIRVQVEDKKRIGFVHLKFPGIVNHAWLIEHIYKNQSGWTLAVVDSNFPDQTRTIHYVKGSSSIFDEAYGFSFSPRLTEVSESLKIEKAIKSNCQSRTRLP